jgi:4-hydroxy-tetrahydrodipicolinate synthase
MKLTDGFYTALGTPIDDNGDLVAESLKKHIEQQIEYGASGLLLMGSMGIEGYLKNTTFAETVKVGAAANNGRLPLFVGCMDNSIVKVMEKIALIGDAKIDGVVLTTPFYGRLDDAEIVNYFRTIADKSPYPVYLYDLAVVTKLKITLPIIDKLIDHPNIVGIKSADWQLLQHIGRKYPEKNFSCLYSGLDTFDYANMMGITKNLDGMFCCTPKNGRKLYDAIIAKDFVTARVHLDNILLMRDTMLKLGLMYSFTYAMNLLGFEGNFHEDYCLPIGDEAKAILKQLMIDIGEL